MAGVPGLAPKVITWEERIKVLSYCADGWSRCRGVMHGEMRGPPIKSSPNARRVRQELVVVRMKEVSREELYTTAKYGRVCPMSRGSSNAGHR